MTSAPAPWDEPPGGLPGLRLNPHSPSKALRRPNTDTCTFCGHHVWYFDRYDGGRIPLVPREFPAGAVPPRARWSVDGGIARPGDMGRSRCWIAHPAVCPGIAHDGADGDGLAGARRALAWRTRKAVAEGRFTAPLPVSPDEAGGGERGAARAADPGERHILAYAGALLLGPAGIDRIRCVASDGDGGRCDATVHDPNAPYQGVWVETEIPVPSDRAGQQTVWAGRMMWVYVLEGLDHVERMRWKNQRCPGHGSTVSTDPDAVPAEWVRFSPFRDERHILTHRPRTARHGGDDRPPVVPRTRCAGRGCVNGKEGAVAEHELVDGGGLVVLAVPAAARAARADAPPPAEPLTARRGTARVRRVPFSGAPPAGAARAGPRRRGSRPGAGSAGSR
ncbi:DUF6083 domain-containing protein [Streptomyces sp. enrichment culture]|uniref:DUF6083 domain-containing protein n=1 Tax=Streptomyces sp. enrichment culture TaxID=1795815 RepID=UPI003F543502